MKWPINQVMIRHGRPPNFYSYSSSAAAAWTKFLASILLLYWMGRAVASVVGGSTFSKVYVWIESDKKSLFIEEKLNMPRWANTNVFRYKLRTRVHFWMQKKDIAQFNSIIFFQNVKIFG